MKNEINSRDEIRKYIKYTYAGGGGQSTIGNEEQTINNRQVSSIGEPKIPGFSACPRDSSNDLKLCITTYIATCTAIVRMNPHIQCDLNSVRLILLLNYTSST